MIKTTNKQLVLKRKQDGASLIEYAVIAAVLVGIIVAVLPALGDGLTESFEAITTRITGAATQ